MTINRVWAIPSTNTFSIPPIADLLTRKVLPIKQGGGVILDPFANNSKKFSTITNDLNPLFDTDFHLPAIEFLKIQKDETADIVLLDPPYSPTQTKRCYDSIGIETQKADTQNTFFNEVVKQIVRVLKKGGLCVSFGWNTRGLDKWGKIEEILIVWHGGCHNDTLVTVSTLIEKSGNLFEFEASP